MSAQAFPHQFLPVFHNLRREFARRIKELFASARSGRITVPAYLELLEAHKIAGIQRLLYAAKAFQLPFAMVKEFEVQRERGLTDNDVQELSRVLDELDSDGRVKD